MELLGRIAASRHGIGNPPTADAIAIAAALGQPWADVVLSGGVTPGQLASNLAALDVHLGADELTELGAIAVPAESYWESRAQLPWS